MTAPPLDPPATFPTRTVGLQGLHPRDLYRLHPGGQRTNAAA